MRILVTGSAGFIGSNLTRRLRTEYPDAFILGVDNYWTGIPRDASGLDEEIECSVAHLRDYVGSAFQFDHVWHLASPASPQHYQANPFGTVRANVWGLMECLETLKPDGRIFFTSTSEVYGDPKVSPQSESYVGSVNALGPRACYDESKRLCETILMDAARAGTEVRVVRLFNVYGPGTLPDDGRAVSNFITQGLRGGPITVYGTGMQTRCFTYIDDVLEGLLQVMQGDYDRPINLGTDRETPVLDIARHVSDALGGIPIVHEPPAIDDPQQRLPDLTLARKLIDWNPPTTYEVGIARTIDYFREVLK